MPKRLLRLGLSLWMICDMVFDAMQMRTYWNHANAHRELSYFICAMTSWFLPPLIYLFVSWFLLNGKGKIFSTLMQKNFGQGLQESNWCKQFLLFLVFLLLDLTKATIMVYLYIPAMDVILAFSEIIYGRNKKMSQAMPGLKLFEQFGEAVPQIVIALAFYINVNKGSDTLLGTIELQNQSVKLSKTLVSILLSVGSILIGIAGGAKNWKTTRAMVEHNTEEFNALTAPRKELERVWKTVGNVPHDIVGSTNNLAGRAVRRLSIHRRR